MHTPAAAFVPNTMNVGLFRSVLFLAAPKNSSGLVQSNCMVAVSWDERGSLAAERG